MAKPIFRNVSLRIADCGYVDAELRSSENKIFSAFSAFSAVIVAWPHGSRAALAQCPIASERGSARRADRDRAAARGQLADREHAARRPGFEIDRDAKSGEREGAGGSRRHRGEGGQVERSRGRTSRRQRLVEIWELTGALPAPAASTPDVRRIGRATRNIACDEQDRSRLRRRAQATLDALKSTEARSPCGMRATAAKPPRSARRRRAAISSVDRQRDPLTRRAIAVGRVTPAEIAGGGMPAARLAAQTVPRRSRTDGRRQAACVSALAAAARRAESPPRAPAKANTTAPSSGKHVFRLRESRHRRAQPADLQSLRESAGSDARSTRTSAAAGWQQPPMAAGPDCTELRIDGQAVDLVG